MISTAIRNWRAKMPRKKPDELDKDIRPEVETKVEIDAATDAVMG